MMSSRRTRCRSAAATFLGNTIGFLSGETSTDDQEVAARSRHLPRLASQHITPPLDVVPSTAEATADGQPHTH
jgi:hypothetical protein